jgi:hypothetical protein
MRLPSQEEKFVNCGSRLRKQVKHVLLSSLGVISYQLTFISSQYKVWP